MTTTINTDLSAARVQSAVEAILEVLGEPCTDAQQRALAAFRAGDSAQLKRLSVVNLSDNYLKCLGYLVSAPKLTPNTDTILAESARSAAAHVHDRTLIQLGDSLERALRG